ncbi:MAG: hypothetical protein PHV32_04190 [Eubacteriales bacterium]|nr:hypothetical protein [Eubacteriales bacterium]
MFKKFKILKYVFNRKVTTLLLIVQVFLALFIMNITIGIINNYSGLEQTVKNSGLIDDYYLSLDNSDNVDYITQKLDGLAGLESIANIEYIRYGSRHDVIIADSEIVHEFQSPLSKGRWLGEQDYKLETDYEIPVIVSDNLKDKYKYGEIYTFEIVLGNRPSTKVILKIKPVGILRKPNYFFSMTGNYMSNVISKDFNGIIIPYFSGLKELYEMPYNRSLLLIPHKNADDALLESWESELSDIGKLDKIALLLQQYKENNKSVAVFFGSIGIVILVLTVVGLSGNSMLSIAYSEKLYAVYFMCGMKWRFGVLLTIIKNILLVLFPALLSMLCFLIFRNILPEFQMHISIGQILLSMGLCLFILLVSSIEPLISLIRRSPVSIIRRWH